VSNNLDVHSSDVIPSDWEITPLKKVVTKLVDGSHSPPSKQENGRPMLSARNIENNQIVFDDFRYIGDKDFEREHSRTRISPGDVLLTIVGSIGRSAVVPDGFQDFTLQRSVAVLTPNGLLPKYLMYQLQAPSLQRHFENSARGTAQKGVYLKTLGETPIRVAPLDQQERIVAEIEKQFSRLDEAVANLKRVKANLKRYKATVLKAAVEGKLVATEADLARQEDRSYKTGEKLLARILTERRQKWSGKAKYKEPVAPDRAHLWELPEGWVWASLDQLLRNITDGDHQPPPQTDSGVPFLVIGNVRTGELDFTDTRFVSQEYAKAVDDFRKPIRGDILYSLVGSYGIAVPVKTNRDFCIQRHIAVLRPHELSPSAYLVHVLNSSFAFKQATAVATGTAQKTVPLAGLRRFAIPLPPLAEQQRIVLDVERRLSVVEGLEAVVNDNLQRAVRLRESILQQAFEGKLLTPEVHQKIPVSEDFAIAPESAGNLWKV
jgi:type I restriction enzyme, S subunit